MIWAVSVIKFGEDGMKREIVPKESEGRLKTCVLHHLTYRRFIFS